jgi:hypothetical protein
MGYFGLGFWIAIGSQADFVAKEGAIRLRSLSQQECRVSVAASSHATDVGMRFGEKSQQQSITGS